MQIQGRKTAVFLVFSTNKPSETGAKWRERLYRFRPMILTIVDTAQQLGMSSASVMREICAQGLARQPITIRFHFEPQIS